jgi:hypothetical protein
MAARVRIARQHHWRELIVERKRRQRRLAENYTFAAGVVSN